MIRVVEYEHRHSQRIKLQPRQMLGETENYSSGFTILRDDEPLVCCGIAIENYVPVLWGLFSADAGPVMKRTVGIVKRLIALHSGYLWTMARCDWPEAIRLIKILGFEPTEIYVDAPDGRNRLFTRYC